MSQNWHLLDTFAMVNYFLVFLFTVVVDVEHYDFACLLISEWCVCVDFPVHWSQHERLARIQLISSHHSRQLSCCTSGALDGDGGGKV